ncbi:pupal cuticle protein G1A-like [Bacillus rossius redtenbacheri]|uniref:pupal cuticle protein G1A-like n=1 Tax=Bacillus rossius redtenbacheri TaxID=93214 RepID=UPI002FDEE3EE
MNSLIFASCLLALAAAEPGYLGGAHLAYNALPVAAAVSSQYHAQDELGQYSYGYSGDTSAKHETRTLDGITQGGYSYLDANGLVQSASYVSDPVNGFRVAATNLPVGPSAPAPAVVAPYAAVHAAPYTAVHAAPYAAVHAAPYAALAGAPLPVADTPEVYAAKVAHFQAHAEAKGHLLGRKKRSPGYLGAAGHGIYAAPAAVVAAPARSFAYSTVAAHAVPAVATYAAAAPAYAAAPAVLAAPARSFGYSTVAAHAVPAVAAYAAAPAAISTYAAAAPLAAHGIAAGSSQYRAQDELGQYSYGYADGNSVKHESRAFDGTTHGAYSYVDGHGLVQSVKYHADALGFRAVGTNFPVAH